MALDSNIRGVTSGNGAEVNAANQMKITAELDAFTNPLNVGNLRLQTELDPGKITAAPILISPELDGDYRLRIAQDTLMDEEVFNYTAQNTGKHQSVSTTMAATWTAGQFTTNSGSITTTTTGYALQTYASFPNSGAQTLSGDFEMSFSAQPSANNFVEFGFTTNITSATAAPPDGVFVRLSASGFQGVVSFNGTETSSGVWTGFNNTGTYTYTNSKRYQFIIYTNATSAYFWLSDGTNTWLMAQIALPVGTGRVNMGSGLKAFVQHRITGGAAGAVLQANLNAYSVRVGGANYANTMGQAGNRMFGSYQGLSGGTMGTLANYANSANPTAAVPTNTTAALGTGLGGQFWETCTLAANTDGIISSYQVPLPTANVPGRRLVITGVKIDTYIQTAITAGGYNEQWSLAFGHTAVSLATAEATNAKAPRRIALGSRTVAATATALTQLATIQMDFSSGPIYVNPGEFIQTVKKNVGTAGTAGTEAHTVTFVYGWE